jgi:hypothetical protein
VEHINVMDVRPLDRDTVLVLKDVRFVLEHLPEKAEALTLLWDGRIFACMGFWSPLPGMAEVWLIPSIYVKYNALGFVRTVDHYLKIAAETFLWGRVQTVTRMDMFHRRWMESLGFVEEGVMKNYYQGQDYILSARYFNWGKT